jgi:hypothetical protein
MNPVRIVALVIAGVSLVSTAADATLCAKKSGAIVMRDECRKRETAVSPSQLGGLAGPSGADGSQGARGEKGEKGDPGDFRVVDSTGRFVGIVDVGHPDAIAVRVPDVGLGILYSEQDGQGFYQDGVTLYHESADCEGEPLFGVSRYELIQYVGAFGNFAYFPRLPGDTRTILSREYDANTCATFVTGRGLCCENFAATEAFVASIVAVPLSSLGTPPFHIAH